jgi:predicted esterase
MASPSSHELRVERRARVLTLGDPSRARAVWFLLHGYAQLAAPFIESCRALEAPDRLLVAPEALSRFYLRHGDGPVGATWMTREERTADIADYVAYLDRVAAWVERDLGVRSSSRVVLGFSQGASTAWRWAALGHSMFERVIGFGGGVPPELDLAALAARAPNLRASLVRGTADTWYTAEGARADAERLALARIPVELSTFDGGHELDTALLARIAVGTHA